jgi:hypothetical protein
MKMFRHALIASMMLLPGHSWASDDEEQKVVYRQKTEIDFEDLEIEGTLQKPQSALVLERKKANFNPLVKLRTDWNEEIDQSVDEVK